MVGSSPGGINDISSRLVARHLGRFIPGNPSIIVQNLPGGGGLVTANRIYNAAERDGSVFAKLERAIPQLAIQGNRNANFDPRRFTWLGSLSSYTDDAYMLLINASHPACTANDLKRPGNRSRQPGIEQPDLWSYLARGSRPESERRARLHGRRTDLPFHAEGELDGQMIRLSWVRSGQRDLWNWQAFRPLLQFGRNTRLKELADIPTGRELATDAESEALIEFAELPFFMALPFAAPPGLPADRARALGEAFMTMCRDRTFIEDAQAIGIDVSPIDDADVAKLIARLIETPKEVIARYNALGTSNRK
jgi:tripartite-type tricarboxylate transporter receptor subunit TctC